MGFQRRASAAQSGRQRRARGACRALGGGLLLLLPLLAGRWLGYAPRHFAVPRAAAEPCGPRAPRLAGNAARAPGQPASEPRWILAAVDNVDLQRQRSSLLDYGRAAWTSIYTALWGPPSFPEKEENDEVGSSSVLASLMDGLEDLHARIDSVNATIMGVVKDAQSGIAEMSSQIGSSLGALPEPKDLYLFVKNYDWSLRYRVRRVAADLDVDTPLELEWVKLRKAPKEPAEVLRGMATWDLFDWTNTAPVGHKGFMIEVTKAVGSGVEAVINMLKGRGFNLIVNPDGISMAPPEATAQPRRVTHCWVDAGNLFFPSVRTINFFNSQESVLAWQA